MSVPFTVRVTDPRWRSDAEAWLDARLREVGLEVAGSVEQPRVRPWSTLLTADTDAGRVWFKADQEDFAFEAGLQEVLARLLPEHFQAPLAVDPERGWMLTLDHGPSLGEGEPPSTEDWTSLMREAARIQQRLAPHRDELLATGLPDRSPATVPALFDALRARHQRYSRGHPGHITAIEDAALARARPLVTAAAQRVEESRLPDSWNHGDLHPYNAYRVADGHRLFDLGDGSWGAAAEIVAVPLEWLGYTDSDIDPAALVSAYCDEWGVSCADRPDWDDIRLLHAVNRAQVWSAWLDDTTPAELEQWGGNGAEHLTSVLDVLGMREGPASVEDAGP